MLRFAGLLIAGALAAGAQAPNTLSDQERRDGWVLLFDGKTMQGWDDPRLKTPPGDAWTIEDGWLKANAHPRITEDLFSSAKYRNFELQWEWIISPGGNSGLKYRIQKHLFLAPRDAKHLTEKFETQVERSVLEPVLKRPERGQDYVIGFEFQLTDDTANDDARSDGKHTAGALYDMVAPASKETHPAGKVNQSRILLKGNHVEHWVNGVKVVNSSLDSAAALKGIETRWATAPHVRQLMAEQPEKDCPISLQNHGDEAWFRSLKIRPVSDSGQ